MKKHGLKKRNLKKIIKNIGTKSVVLSILVFVLTVAATAFGGYQLYKSVKESIHLQGRVNSVQSAKAFDNYLLVRMNTVMLAAHVVDEMNAHLSKPVDIDRLKEMLGELLETPAL